MTVSPNRQSRTSFTFHVSRFTFSIPLVGLFLLTLLVYFPPYSWAWIGDDYVQLDYIKDFVANPQYFYRFFNPYFVGWYYRPFQNIWLIVNRLLFGLNPFGYYWLQLCVHLLAVALVYRVAREWRLRPFPALCAAALFAIHGHFMDVVAWISSIAIVTVAVWNLLVLWLFSRYLKRPNWRWLAGTAVVCLLAFVTHEEAVLLPPFLFLWWLLEGRGAKREERRERSEQRGANRSSFTLYVSRFTLHVSRLLRTPSLLFTFLFLFAGCAAYLYIQFTRPNLTIELGSTPSSHWVEYLSPLPISQFVVDAFTRFTMLTQWREQITAWSYLATYALLILVAVWVWKGGQVTRLGWLWLVIHLAFIYLALWSQKPHLFAGRHIYNAGIGLALAIGEVTGKLEEREARGGERKDRSSLFALRSSMIAGLVIVVLLVAHTLITRQAQTDWVVMAEEDRDAAQKMKTIMPNVTDDTHVFANRFPITPNFMRSFTQVWYNHFLSPPSGGLEALKLHGEATPDFYVFDYDPGSRLLTNLMPELQDHAKTVFIWSQLPVARVLLPDGTDEPTTEEQFTDGVVTGPADALRYTLRVVPPAEGWLSLSYTATVPADGVLRFALRQEVDKNPLIFRVTIIGGGENGRILFEGAITETEQAWQEVVIPLEEFGGETAVFQFDVSGDGQTKGYWANPRFTID